MTAATRLTWLNDLPAADAEAEFRACCATKAWTRAVTAARPFPDAPAVQAAADAALAALTWPDVEEAMAAHPRIGERAAGAAREATWSKGEQSGTATAAPEVRTALAEGNAEYEKRFGRVFLICATGLSAQQMLDMLRKRLRNDEPTERTVVREELAKITRLRLAKLLVGR